MKQTNKYNLPERIVRLLPELRKPKPKRTGVTTLIDCPRINTLKIERFDDIEYDVSDYLSTIIGIAVHERCENLATEEDDAEHKLEDTTDMNGNPLGITLVGKADNYIDGVIQDTKTKAVGFKKFGDSVKKIEEQLNVYAWQRRKRGQEVTKLTADIFYRDWKLSQAKYNKDYPPISYEQLELPLWSYEDQNRYVLEQIEYHLQSPYDCSDRWEKPTTYAVMTKGKKRAERVLDSMEEAEQWMKENRGTHIEVRKGECIRCQNYCPVRSTCQWSACCINKFKGLTDAEISKKSC